MYSDDSFSLDSVVILVQEVNKITVEFGDMYSLHSIRKVIFVSDKRFLCAQCLLVTSVCS